MKLHFLHLFLFTTSCLLSRGQAVSDVNFEKAVDWLNCKSIELSLKDKPDLAAFQSSCNCKTTNIESIRLFFQSRNLSATAELSEEINTLKSQNQHQGSLDDAIEFLSSTIFNDPQFPKLTSFVKNRTPNGEQTQDLKDYQKTLKIDLKRILEDPSYVRNQVNSDISELKRKIEKLEKDIDSDKNSSNWYKTINSYLVVPAFLIGLLALILFIKMKKNEDSEIDRTDIIEEVKKSKRMNSHFATIETVTSLERNMNQKYKEMEEKIKDVKNTISHLQNTNTTDKIPPNPSTREISGSKDETSKVFFSSIPNANGIFSKETLHDSFIEGQTIYRFNMTEKSKATFEIENKNASIKLALQYRDIRIEPACTALNSFRPETVSIKTEKKGKATLTENGHWQITEKAQIKYES